MFTVLFIVVAPFKVVTPVTVNVLDNVVAPVIVAVPPIDTGPGHLAPPF